MSIEIKTPMLPESVSEATVLSWTKLVGESVERDEVLIELETEKIVLEVPAPQSGQVGRIMKGEGSVTVEGDILGVIETGKTESRPQPAEPAATPKPEPVAPPEVKTEPEKPEPILSPAARRVAAEHKIDVSKVSGTGKDGRITKPDVESMVQAEAQPEPEKLVKEIAEALPQPEEAPSVTPPTSNERSVRHQTMSRIRRTIADRLVQSQQTAALLTTFNEVDMSAVMDLRKKYRDEFEKKHETRLGFMSFFVKAAVESLKAIPAVNAQIDGNEIVYHNYCDVGIAVSSPRGLVVPILRNAERMSFAEIEQQIRDFGGRAQRGALTLAELSGGTFTITNGGVFGSLVSTPIVNPPQSAILGMHKIQERPMAEDGKVVIRPMMYLALTYDHRIIDGREAVTFLVGIKRGLEDPSRLLLEL